MLYIILTIAVLLLIATKSLSLFKRKLKKTLSQNSRILITGGLNGIGEQIVYEFSRQHACTIIVIDRSNEHQKQVEEQVLKYQAKFVFFQCDLGDEIQTQHTIDQILQNYSPLDVVINNAGTTSHQFIQDLTLERIRYVTRVNYLACAQIGLAALKQWQSGKRPLLHIVNIGSVASLVYGLKTAEYAASKAALLLLSESIRQEAKSLKLDIKISEFLPYAVNTRLFAGFQPRFQSFLPILDKNYVAKIIYEGIMLEEEQIFIPRIDKYAAIVLRMLPPLFADALLSFMQGNVDGMQPHSEILK